MAQRFGLDQNVKDYIDAAASAGAAPISAAPVDYVAAIVATSLLTDGNAVAPSDGDKLTVAGKQYTFKTALTPLEGEVLINTTADAALLNLARAINHTGTPNTDYKCAAANANVSSSASVVSHAITLTALVAGVAGNSLAVTQDTGTSFTVAAFASGADAIPGTVGTAGMIGTFGGVAYICLANATATDTGKWKKISTASL
jgi:hypothetical protein